MLTRLNIISREISLRRQGKFNKTLKYHKVYTIREIFTEKPASENMNIKKF
jgi:hypothetical protein